jgi:hypothetical protein
MALPILFLAAAVAGGLRAQPVRVYSEFQRVDPFCAVAAADKAERPREVLSPALARSAYATFQAVISVPEGRQYSLFVGQNPENAVKVAAYRPVWVKRGDAYIPDGLEPLTIHTTGEVAPEDPASRIPGQTCRVVWLDVWVPPDAPVRRTRFEVQLSIGTQWIIYPMELRVSSLVAPAAQGPFEPLPPPEAPASETAARVMRSYICGTQPGNGDGGPLTIRRLVRRNARQDMALAHSLEQNGGKAALAAQLLEAVGATDKAKWCEAPAGHREMGAEWYLHVRDFLLHSNPLNPAELPKPKVAVKPVE